MTKRTLMAHICRASSGPLDGGRMKIIRAELDRLYLIEAAAIEPCREDQPFYSETLIPLRDAINRRRTK